MPGVPPSSVKALILAGGGGTRLRPLTYTTPKQLLPIAGKPIFYFVLEQIARAGIKDVGIIVSPSNQADFKAAVGDGGRWGLRVSYIVQEKALGLAHAVQTGHGFLGKSYFMVFLGDNLYQDELRPYVEEYAQKPDEALIVVKEVPNPQAFGVVEVDARGRPTRLVEKPKEPKSNLAIVGTYFFSPAAHDVIATLKPSARGELELTDTIQGLIDRGNPVRLRVMKGWWLDTGRRSDMLAANQTVLKTVAKRDIQGTVDAGSAVHGEVQIGAGTTVQRSHIEGPAIIGEGCQISDATIKPFTAIGAKCRIDGFTIGNSILLDGCVLTGHGELADSLLGKRCQVTARGGAKLGGLFADDTQAEV